MTTTPPTNTTKAMRDRVDQLLLLARGDSAVQDQEAAGMRQLINSGVIPAKGCPDDALTALGFDLGAQVDGDRLFRHATLPTGWRLQASDDPRTAYVIDDQGRDRLLVWYKAAFYDRCATISLLPIDEDE